MVERSLADRNLTEFFRELVQSAMRAQAVSASVDTEFYLVRLLEAFAHPEHGVWDKPLALEYLESFHAPQALRFGKLKRVGDVSLFVSGVFMEGLHAKMVSSDYYQQLGQSAYSALANTGGPVPKDLFSELSGRFTDFVRVLAQLSLDDLFPGDTTTLRVYTRWLYTRGAVDAAWLMRKGLIPAAGKREPVH